MDTPKGTETPVAKLHESGQWEDTYGALGPAKPGLASRQDPVGEFPTGPAIRERFPDVVATAQDGKVIDLHEHRADRASVFVFYRSAVW